MTVLLLVEHGPEGVDELSRQALTLARQLGEPVEALSSAPAAPKPRRAWARTA